MERIGIGNLWWQRGTFGHRACTRDSIYSSELDPSLTGIPDTVDNDLFTGTDNSIHDIIFALIYRGWLVSIISESGVRVTFCLTLMLKDVSDMVRESDNITVTEIKSSNIESAETWAPCLASIELWPCRSMTKSCMILLVMESTEMLENQIN